MTVDELRSLTDAGDIDGIVAALEPLSEAERKGLAPLAEEFADQLAGAARGDLEREMAAVRRKVDQQGGWTDEDHQAVKEARQKAASRPKGPAAAQDAWIGRWLVVLGCRDVKDVRTELSQVARDTETLCGFNAAMTDEEEADRYQVASADVAADRGETWLWDWAAKQNSWRAVRRLLKRECEPPRSSELPRALHCVMHRSSFDPDADLELVAPHLIAYAERESYFHFYGATPAEIAAWQDGWDARTNGGVLHLTMLAVARRHLQRRDVHRFLIRQAIGSELRDDRLGFRKVLESFPPTADEMHADVRRWNDLLRCEESAVQSTGVKLWQASVKTRPLQEATLKELELLARSGGVGLAKACVRLAASAAKKAVDAWREAERVLVEAAHHENEGVRGAAVAALAKRPKRAKVTPELWRPLVESADREVAEAAAEIAGEKLPEEDASAVETPVDVPELKKRAAALPEELRRSAGVDASMASLEAGELPARFAPVPGGVPVLCGRDRLEPIEDFDDFVAEVLALGAKPREVTGDRIERVIDAAVRFRGQEIEDGEQRFAALAKQLRREVDVFETSKLAGFSPLAFELLTLIRSVRRGEDLGQGGNNDGTVPFGVHEGVVKRLKALRKRGEVLDGLPALSAATHAGGWIEPSVLADRLKDYEAGQVPLQEMSAAVSRLAPDGRSPSLYRTRMSMTGLESSTAASNATLTPARGFADDIPDPAAAAMLRVACGGEETSDLPAEYRDGCRCAADPRRFAGEVSFAGLPLSLAETPKPDFDAVRKLLASGDFDALADVGQNFLSDQMRSMFVLRKTPEAETLCGPELDEEAWKSGVPLGWEDFRPHNRNMLALSCWPIDFAAASSPTRPEFAAALLANVLFDGLRPGRPSTPVAAYADRLADPDVRWTDAEAAVVLLCLCHGKGDNRSLGVDLLIEAASDGRCDAAFLEPIAATLVDHGDIKPTRLVEGLGEVAATGPLPAAVVAGVLDGLLAPHEKPPKWGAKAIPILAAACETSGLPPDRSSGLLKSMTGGSASAKAAKRAMAVSGPPTVAATEFVEAALARAERWREARGE